MDLNLQMNERRLKPLKIVALYCLLVETVSGVKSKTWSRDGAPTYLQQWMETQTPGMYSGWLGRGGAAETGQTQSSNLPPAVGGDTDLGYELRLVGIGVGQHRRAPIYL